ncbi:hypothetical protein JSO61_004605 [Riemerella anatipestifer]|uniref:hypothetical protein n=1 Tax=Riemerella anatipestifer TaxID=34085 RepID=UPI002A84F247|nr:hypothetical protein [Riemerella anatipestifer]
MTTQITKLSVFAFLGLGLVAYGQSGKVGINISSPRATLDVQLNATNGQDNAKTNEGILAPKLSKTRVASIETPVEGTLVYVIDDADKTNGAIGAYKGTDPRVAKITEKGYYYYDGTEWVKSTAGAKEQEWVYNGTDAIYAKRAKDNNHSFEIFDNGKTYINQGNVNWNDVIMGDGVNLIRKDPRGEKANIILQNSSVLDKTAVADPDGQSWYEYNKNIGLLNESHVSSATGTKKRYEHISNDFIVQGVTTPFHSVDVFKTAGSHLSNTTINSFTAANIHSFIGGQANTTPTAKASFAIRAWAHNYGTSDEITAIRSGVVNYNNANAKVLRGIYNTLNTRSATDILAHSVNQAKGIENIVSVAPSGTVENYLLGITNTVDIKENATVKGNGVRGIISYLTLRENAKSETFCTNILSRPNIATNATMANLAEFGNYTTIADGASIGDYIGYEFVSTEISAKANITNMYGIKLTDVNKATGSNYAIYTGLGTIRFGDNVGIGVDTPAEKLEVAGKVKATSFIGTNGAAIFPDYVFQKYYTGTSSLKADYSFKTLSQVEDFVKTNGHLPGYQSAEAIKKQGYIDLMATQLTNVEKIEELYLHSIEQDKALKAKDAKIAELEARLQKLEALLVK